MVRAAERAAYAANPERKRANVSAWRAENPHKRQEIDRRHYLKFADKKRAQAAQWSSRNHERRNENMRNWYREKRRTDPMYRLRSSVSAYLWWCLSTNKAGRKTEDLLGYTIASLRLHLERQFLPGMSWDNYGDWHIDHILPVSSFSFTAPEDPDFRACWAITNLRPLWATDNLVKNNKRTHLL